MVWKHYKTDISSVMLSNKFRASIDSLDAWTYRWVLYECPQQARIMRHQGGESAMFLLRIIRSTILRHFQVIEGIKLKVQR